MNIKNIHEMVEDNGILFLSYGSLMSHALIQAMTESLEKETENNNISMGVATNIFTIFIELSQNMMNYSKNKDIDSREIVPGGLIIISKNEEENCYYISSKNIVSVDDKNKMQPKLNDITTMNRDEIKKRYKELRRSGKDTHAKGGGLGFYEIAKRCNHVEYDFQEINHDKFYFHIKTRIDIKIKN